MTEFQEPVPGLPVSYCSLGVAWMSDMAPIPKIKGLPSFEHIGLIVQSLVCFSVLFLSKMSAMGTSATVIQRA
jgi:hypothetical protein